MLGIQHLLLMALVLVSSTAQEQDEDSTALLRKRRLADYVVVCNEDGEGGYTMNNITMDYLRDHLARGAIRAFSTVDGMDPPHIVDDACELNLACQMVIRGPVDAIVTSGGPGTGDIKNTFDQRSMHPKYISGKTLAAEYTGIHHEDFRTFEWFSNTGNTQAFVIYDLGAQHFIDALLFWNAANQYSRIQVGVSNDGNTYNLLGEFKPRVNDVEYSEELWEFPNSVVEARYVMFEMMECGGDIFACAIGEVAFRACQ